MDEKTTHTTRTVTINGKNKIVYVRTEETVREMDMYRMGFFARYEPLNLTLFEDKLKANQLIISAPYEEAKRVIRTRLGLDRRTHRVLTGTTLLQHYFSGESYREGFPVFKQLYILFGYSESTNRRLHEVIVESLYTRYHNDSHFWMVMPNNIEVAAAQWGDALLNLKVFPQLSIPEQERTEGLPPVTRPVSVANPVTSTAVGGPGPGAVYRHPTYPETPDEFDAVPPPLGGDPNEERRRKRERQKWDRKHHE